jgi:hypothetical protein
MLVIYLREKDYNIKLPGQIKTGTKIVLSNKFYTFLNYTQGKGAGNKCFGEYGVMKLADTKNNKIIEEIAFQYTPVICVNNNES